MTTGVGLGAVAALGAAVCYEVSYAGQALEARQVPVRRTIEASLLVSLVRRPLWIAAIALAAVGWPLQLLALSLAPLTLVQPIIALGIVVLLVLAARILRERIGGAEIVSCAGVVLGVAGIAWSAPEHTSSHAGPLALGLALGLLGVFAVWPYLAAIAGRGAISAPGLVLAAGAGDAWSAFGAKLLVDEVSRGSWGAALGFAAASAAALVAGLVSETAALQRYPASRVGPAVLAMQVAIPVILAPVVGGEHWGSTPFNGGALVVSIVIVVISGGFLARSRALVGLGEYDRGGRGQPGIAQVRRSSHLEGAHER